LPDRTTAFFNSGHLRNRKIAYIFKENTTGSKTFNILGDARGRWRDGLQITLPERRFCFLHKVRLFDNVFHYSFFKFFQTNTKYPYILQLSSLIKI